MSRAIERAADEMAKRRTRRGFLGVLAKAGVVASGAMFGLVGLGGEAAATYQWACCFFPDNSPACAHCPSCNSGVIDTYTWSCCDANNCQWTCKDCTMRTSYCSCATYIGQGGCGGNCLSGAPIRRSA